MIDVSTPGRAQRHHVEFVMGMAVSIDIRNEVETTVVDEAVAWLHHVDATFSTHNQDSPISAMGRGELTYADASDEIKEVLRLCEVMFLQTKGAFNVFEVPAPNGTRLDPSGLVKGWAVERAAALLEANGCRNFCLNAGGDVVLRGEPEAGRAWRIGIRHPNDAEALALVVQSHGSLAIATSATYERGEHIVDPRTGLKPLSLASATVVGPDLTLADAYATAAFVMGLDVLEWIADFAGYDAYVITRTGSTHWTPGFNKYRLDGPQPEVTA